MTDVKNSLVRYRIASYLKKIDISEYDEISLYTKDKICNGKNLITDFVIDTNEDKNSQLSYKMIGVDYFFIA